jgi:Mg/Co/Ni transporter MgtE
MDLFTTLADLPAPLAAGGQSSRRVGDAMRTVPVKVPSWFTVGAALRVARLKRAEQVVVLDRQQLVARWMTSSRRSVTPDTLQSEAARLMEEQGLDCLPVVGGALFLGIVTRADLR